MSVDLITASYERLYQGLDSAVRLGSTKLKANNSWLWNRFSKRTHFRLIERDPEVLERLTELATDASVAGGRSDMKVKKWSKREIRVSMRKDSSLHKLFLSAGKETMSHGWLDRVLGNFDSTNTVTR